MFFYNEKGECDFITRKGTKINSAIQVCYDLNNDNKEREINGLMEVLTKFKLDEGMILTFDKEEEIKIDNKIINVKPVWKWIMLIKQDT